MDTLFLLIVCDMTCDVTISFSSLQMIYLDGKTVMVKPYSANKVHCLLHQVKSASLFDNVLVVLRMNSSDPAFYAQEISNDGSFGNSPIVRCLFENCG